MYMLLLCGLLCSIFSVSSANNRNNVCRNKEDYDNKFNNLNCWYEPDVEMDTGEIITHHGYPLEIYDVTTQDGYILKLFRIPHGKNTEKNDKIILQPLLFFHGLLSSSAFWVTNGNKSIGFIMADKGYDVWLGNCRGNVHGKRHVALSVNNKKFWNYSFHEMGIYDISSILDLIYKVTKRNDIITIGHSMGSVIELVYASELPEVAKNRVKSMVYLAPAAFLIDVKSPINAFMELWPMLEDLSKRFGLGELLSEEQLPRQLIMSVCFGSRIQYETCERLALFIFGPNSGDLLPEHFPVILSHYPQGTSFKTVIHLAQEVITRKFHRYDYGPELNMKYYKSQKPPNYNLSRISIPGHIIYSANDWLATKEGSLMLFNNLPETNTIYEIKDKTYNHWDFAYSQSVIDEVIHPLLDILSKYKTNIYIKTAN